MHRLFFLFPLIALATLASQTVTETSQPVLLYVSEAAKMLALSRARVYQMVASGELPHVRFGKAVRVPRAALLRYIEQQTIAGNDGASWGR